jgi:hypothetical protein
MTKTKIVKLKGNGLVRIQKKVSWKYDHNIGDEFLFFGCALLDIFLVVLAIYGIVASFERKDGIESLFVMLCTVAFLSFISFIFSLFFWKREVDWIKVKP